MKKRVFSVLLASALLMGTLPIEPLYAAEPDRQTSETSRQDASCTVHSVSTPRNENAMNFTYDVDDDGNATITKYSGSEETELVIPEKINGYPVVKIGRSAFERNTSIRTVKIANSVRSIDHYAFKGCTALVGVQLSTNLEYLGTNAFTNCTSLKEIWLPKTLNSVGAAPFKGSGISSIEIEKGAEIVANNLFQGLDSIESVTIPTTVITIGDNAFSGCANLKLVSIPKTVTTIGAGAFAGCANLELSEIPYSVTKIGNSAFKNCAKIKVNLPGALRDVGSSIFEGCPLVTTVSIPNTLETANSPFNKSKIQTALILEGIKKLPNNLFRDAEDLTQVTIPESVKIIGDNAFLNCKKLSKFKRVETQPAQERLVLPSNLEALGSNAFGKCVALKKIWIPNTLKTTGGSGPFENSGLESVEIQEGIEILPARLFKNVANLTQMDIPQSVRTISNSVFEGCSSLNALSIPDAVTSFGDYALKGTALPKFVFTDRIQKIGKGLFRDCSALRTFQWNNVITEVPAETFWGCGALTNINIPNVVTKIDNRAFQGCGALLSITLPTCLTAIGDFAFLDCESLQGIAFPDGLKTLGKQAFKNCEALASLTIGNCLQNIPEQCFFECASLTELELPYSIKTIGTLAFANCTGLTELTVLRHVNKIEDNAFSYAENMTIRCVEGSYAHNFATLHEIKHILINIPATKIKLNQKSVDIWKQKTFQLIPSFEPRIFSDAVEWISSDEKVAKVDDCGMVTALNLGEATITVKAGTKSASCKVTVLQPVTGINLNKTTLTVDKGGTFQLVPTIKPSNASNKTVIWTSSNNSIAKVDSSGLVSGVNSGTATITATAADGSGVSQKCEVTVHVHNFNYEVTRKPSTSATGILTCTCFVCGRVSTVTLPKLNKRKRDIDQGLAGFRLRRFTIIFVLAPRCPLAAGVFEAGLFAELCPAAVVFLFHTDFHCTKGENRV
ncbi:MAG: leucine-rich repeat protein [Oscillospiraceae bacterium]|nr:leucine-rich repeat protein [Oscillospiraceae bacterium]